MPPTDDRETAGLDGTEGSNLCRRATRFGTVLARMAPESHPSTATEVRRRAVAAPPGSFLRRKDFDGSDRAVESALRRRVLDGELIRVRRGIYYRGKPTRFGMTRPSILEAALAAAGLGAGPAGVAAAHLLGLTTQVPGVIEVAVPGKVPEPMPGVRFRLRPFETARDATRTGRSRRDRGAARPGCCRGI